MITATDFELVSLDHEETLLNGDIHNTRHLLNDNSKPPKQMKLSFTVDGKTQESVLHRKQGAFKPDATLTFAVEGKTEEYESVQAPELFTYYSEDKNWVLTFHTDSKFDGLIFSDQDNSIHHFVAENGKFVVDDRVSEWFPSAGNEAIKSRKLTSEANGIDYWDDCHPAQSAGLSGLSLGFVIGNVHFKSFGQQTSLNHINSYVSLSNEIYERQMDISLTIGDVFIATQPNIESFLPGSCSQSIRTQLSGMARWRKPSNQVLWHLIDDCFGTFDTTLGIAYLGTLCTSNNVGVNYYSERDYPDPETYPTWATFAHEAGHNFDGQHSFEEGQGRTGGIMDYGFLRNRLINGEIQFNSQYREREVCREVASAYSRGCLDVGIAPSPTSQLTTPVAERVEIFAERERNLKCVKHAHRVPGNAAHLKRFNHKSRVQCRKECADRENCSGFVFAKDGWCELLEDVNVNDLSYATTFNTVICSERELTAEQLFKSEDDILDEEGAERFQEQCCVETENQGFSGMNLQFFQQAGLTIEECETECVQNSRCEGVTFDPVSNPDEPGCMLFGGREFSHEREGFSGATSMSCDRSCISLAVEEVQNSSNSASNVGGIFGGVLLVAGVVGLLAAGFVYRKNQKKGETSETEISAQEGTIYKATL